MTTDPAELTPAELAAQEAAQGETEDPDAPTMTSREVTETFGPQTAAQKIMHTLRELSEPDEDAGGMELTLATVAMGLEKGLADDIAEKQSTGELDVFVLALTQFLATHRSDTARRLVVVELPPGGGRELPTGTKLAFLDRAIEEAESAKSPL